MLNRLIVDLYEKIDGRVITSQLEAITGVTAKSWKSNALTEATLNKALNNAKKYKIEQLRSAQFEEDKIQSFLEHWPKGLYSGLIYEIEFEELKYPHTLSYAEKIDNLSNQLMKAKYNISDAKKVLFKALNELLSSFCFDQNKELISSKISSAQNWEDLESVINELELNTLISLLSLWDIEFCSQYFKKYQLRSLFTLVMPKIDPKAGDIDIDHTISKRRDWFWLPTKRLISFMSCISSFAQTKNWPKKGPSIKSITNGANESKENLIKWGIGEKKFTFQLFLTLWESFFWQNPDKCFYLPSPIFIAAKCWEVLLVKQNKKYKVESLLIIKDDYEKFWQWHAKNLYMELPSHEGKEWPACFNLI